MSSKKKSGNSEAGSTDLAPAPKKRGKLAWHERMTPYLAKIHGFATDVLESTRRDQTADTAALRKAIDFVDSVEAHPSWPVQKGGDVE